MQENTAQRILILGSYYTILRKSETLFYIQNTININNAIIMNIVEKLFSYYNIDTITSSILESKTVLNDSQESERWVILLYAGGKTFKSNIGFNTDIPVGFYAIDCNFQEVV